MTDEQDNAGKAVGELDANASGGREESTTLPGPIPAAGGVPPAACEVAAATPNEHGVFLLPETIDLRRLLKTQGVCRDEFLKKLELYVKLACGEDRRWHFGYSMSFLDGDNSCGWSSPCSVRAQAESRESAFRMAIGEIISLTGGEIGRHGSGKYRAPWKAARKYLHDTWGNGASAQPETHADDGTPAPAEGSGESETPRPPEATAAEPPDTESSAPASAPEVLSAQLSMSAPGALVPESGNQIAVRMAVQAGLPGEVATVMAAPLETLMNEIRAAEKTGHREALRICCCVAAIRWRFHATDPDTWLQKMESTFGYERRLAYQYLKVGSFLMQTLLGIPLLGDGRQAGQTYALKATTAELLLRCDLRKLERISAIPAEHLTRFVVAHPDLPEMARDTVFEEVTKYLGKLPAATVAQKQDAKKLERKEALAQARTQPEWKLDHAAHEIVKLAAKTQAQFGKVDAGHAFRAGFLLQKAAADSMERGESPLADEDLASIEHNLVQVLEFVRKQRAPQGGQ